MNEGDASDLWDRWRAARADDPQLTPERFLESIGADSPENASTLRMLIDLEQAAEPSPLVDDLLTPEGMTFAGFRILRGIGQGSAGVVFLAVRAGDGDEGERVALKVLNPLLSATADARRVILAEAQIARRLDHPGVVRLLGSGIERGYAWIATEYVEGTTLAAVEPGHRARAELALDIGLQLARALEHTHARGVVHRDLKPANVAITSEGMVKILDFGLARAEGTTFAVSRTGEAVGTPLYMAPEQWRGDAEVGPWTDVFAVGLLLWEVATGRRLSVDADMARALRRISSWRRRLSRADLALLPKGLREVVGRCVEPHAENRYRDGAELARALEALRARKRPSAGALPTVTRFAHAWRRHPWRTSLSVAAAFAFLVLCPYAWWTWPMPVRFQEQRGGKTLWIDGEEIGTTPITVRLHPGPHAWKARLGDQPEVYEGDFVVEPRESLFLCEVLDLPYGRFPTPGLPEGVAGERCAWVTVDTPLDAMRLSVDGVGHDLRDGLAAFRLPLGPHTLVIEAEGRRAVRRDIDIRDQALHAYAIEPDKQEDSWTTTLLYSPVDQDVRDDLVRTDGARVYVERSVISVSRPESVVRAYWGPSRSRETATVVMSVDLGVEVHDVEVRMVTNMLASVSGAWSRLEMGPDEDHLVRMVQLGKDQDVAHDWNEKAVSGETTFLDIPVERTAELARALAGKRRVVVRWSAGGVPAGGDDSTGAQILRSHVLPARAVSGELLWSPALRIRAR